jgi:hypothetical protein
MLRQGGTAMTTTLSKDLTIIVPDTPQLPERLEGGPSPAQEKGGPSSAKSPQAIRELRIILPKGIPFILEFWEPKGGWKRLPVADPQIPMYVDLSTPTIDTRGRTMRDPIC